MAHFLPTGTLPAAPHVLASVQPRGTHRAATVLGGPRVGTQKRRLTLTGIVFMQHCSSPGVMPRDVTAGDSDTR